jgi:hypothetical protein
MESTSIFFLLALTVVVGLFIARPFLEKRRVFKNFNEDHERSALLAERDRLITALQELDFDNTLGKIPAEDYPIQRAAMLQRGAEILRALDAYEPIKTKKDAEARMEEAIARKRAESAAATAAPAPAGDDVESLVAARRAARTEKSAGFCPKCGQAVLKSDKFCPKCGKSLK